MFVQIQPSLSRYTIKLLWGFLTCLSLSASLMAQKTILKKIIPHHAKIQHGGGIGYFAIGFGYAGRKEKTELDLLYGYLPAEIGGIDIHSATVKFNFLPVSPIETKTFLLRPLVVGALVNYSFGKQYFTLNPPNYPYRYYNIPTAVNSALFLGGRLGVKLR